MPTDNSPVTLPGGSAGGAADVSRWPCRRRSDRLCIRPNTFQLLRPHRRRPSRRLNTPRRHRPTTSTPESARAAQAQRSPQSSARWREAKRHDGHRHQRRGREPEATCLRRLDNRPRVVDLESPADHRRLAEENPPTVTDSMAAAITESDNAAAELIWERLGDPVTAAHKVEAVLRQYGDPTTVEWRKVRPEFTAFGQTIWSLTDQARFTAAAVCDSSNAQIFALMGQVEGGQSWGLGVIPDTRFKGGWGPSPTGSYLVRQLGVLKSPAGSAAVAVATQPASGSSATAPRNSQKPANG